MATTAASSGSFLITPNVGLMIWTLLLFGISMYVLWKLAFPRIAQALERRQHAIEESIDAADRTRKEADEILAEYRERLREARGQANREQLMEQTRRDIEVETRRAIEEIRSEVADLTVLATEKLTRKSLTEEDQRRLLEDALGELDFSALAPAEDSH
jgi:F-type H+-transporting ATPase subunit b